MDVKKTYDKVDDKLDKVSDEVEEVTKLGTDMNYRHEYVWQRVLIHAALQISWLIGIYTAIFHAKLATFIWSYFIGFLIGESVALGSHRGFSHKSYKMTPTLKFILLFFTTMAGQNSVFTWVRDHKLHHKYSDTDADPHNSTRGFFFSHMGWLLVKKHPLLLEKQRQIDISDLLADKMIMFQYKYFLHLYFIVAVVFPVSVPMYFWNETFWSSFFVAYCLQYVSNLHLTWFINSICHLWGSKPYDKRVRATQSLFTWIVTFGEGWHNYHHAFPWDARHAGYGQMNSICSRMLDLLVYLGLAYDVKIASHNIVYEHIKKYGDETGQKMIENPEKFKY